jgi:hypothetical protein
LKTFNIYGVIWGVEGVHPGRNIHGEQKTRLMINLSWDGEAKQPGMMCMCVDVVMTDNLKMEKNTPNYANGDERSLDQIYLHVR